MIATKEQERKALAQIKKIIDDLGENSYIGTAFEGCFDIAEKNIEDDAADSLFDRLMRTEMENEGLKNTLNAMNELQNDHANEMQEMQHALLTHSDRGLISDALIRLIDLDDRSAKDAAAKVMKNVDDTESDEFKTARAEYKFYFEQREIWNGLFNRVQATLK